MAQGTTPMSGSMASWMGGSICSRILLMYLLAALVKSTAGSLDGVAYTPFRVFGACPSDSEIKQDLAMLQQHSNKVRIYSTECMNLMHILLQQASEGHISLLLGVWIDNRATDQKEIDDLIAVLRLYPNAQLEGIVVGNEVLFRGTLPPSALAGRIVEVRQKVRALGNELGSQVLQNVPVYTVEVIPHPQVIAVSDAVGANIHPYYRADIPNLGDPDVMAQMAVDKTAQQIQLFKSLFPGKPLIVTEIGWPTSSSAIDMHQGSIDMQRLFMKKWAAHASAVGIRYYWFELFDSPWKKPLFAHAAPSMSEFNWGLYYPDRLTAKWK